MWLNLPCLSFFICKARITIIPYSGCLDLFGIRTAPGMSHSLGQGVGGLAGLFVCLFVFVLKSQNSHTCIFSLFPLPSPAPHFHLLRPFSWFSLLPDPSTHLVCLNPASIGSYLVPHRNLLSSLISTGWSINPGPCDSNPEFCPLLGSLTSCPSSVASETFCPSSTPRAPPSQSFML